MMKTYAITALAVFGVVLSIHADLLQTIDGRTFSGRIELRLGPALQISGPSGTHQIPVSNVKNAWFGDAPITHSGLRQLNYKMYRGNWLAMPDFSKLEPSGSGRIAGKLITIHPHNALAGYALVFKGDIFVPAKGAYQFHLGSDDGARLFIDGKPIIDNDGRHGLRYRSGQIALTPGRHEFCLEYFNHIGAAILHLDWGGPGLPRTPLSSVGSIKTETANLNDSVIVISRPGAVLWNGSFVPYPVAAADETKVILSNASENFKLSTVNTTALFFMPITMSRAQALRNARSGVLMSDGQFVEGKLRTLNGSHVEIESVLLGKKTIPIENRVAAVLLRPPAKLQDQLLIHTRHGSTIVTKKAKVEGNVLRVDDGPFGQHKISRDDIVSLHYGRNLSPLTKAWSQWERAEKSERKMIQTRESSAYSRALAVVQVIRQRSILQKQKREAVENLGVVEGVLEKSLAARELMEKIILKDKTELDRAQLELKTKTKLEEVALDNVANAKTCLDESIKSVAIKNDLNDKLMAKIESETKKALDENEKQKKAGEEDLKKFEARVNQSEDKAKKDQAASGEASDMRLKAHVALALEQKLLVAIQSKLDSETKAKVDLDAKIAVAKGVVITAKQDSQKMLSQFNIKQSLFNGAKASVSSAKNSKRTPAVALLNTADKTLERAVLDKATADKQLLDYNSELTILALKKAQAVKELADLTKVHGDKMKMVAKAEADRAKAEAQVTLKQQKMNASRAMLVNLVNTKQEPALVLYRNATNLIAEVKIENAKAKKDLLMLSGERDKLSNIIKLAVTTAMNSESELKKIQSDDKKKPSEKAAAQQKASNDTKEAEVARANLVSLETGKLKLALAQVDASEKKLIKTDAEKAIIEKTLATLANEIQRLTVTYVRDEQLVQSDVARALVLAKTYEAQQGDLDFIIKQKDKISNLTDAAVKAHDGFSQNKVKSAEALVLKSKQQLSAAEKSRDIAAKSVVAVDLDIKRLTQAQKSAEVDLASAQMLLEKAQMNEIKALSIHKDLTEKLANKNVSLAAVLAKKMDKENAIKQAAAIVKQMEKEELIKLKPAIESNAILNLERLQFGELKKQLAHNLKMAKANIETSNALNMKELANAKAAHRRAIDLQKQKEMIFTEATAKLKVAKTEVMGAATEWEQAKLNYKNHLGGLAEISKNIQSTRGQIRTLQGKKSVAESSLNNYLFTNRALLNLN